MALKACTYGSIPYRGLSRRPPWWTHGATDPILCFVITKRKIIYEQNKYRFQKKKTHPIGIGHTYNKLAQKSEAEP